MKPASLPDRVHRVGRLPEPFAWPDWSYAGADGTFGNRFDDPLGTFRVSYAATDRQGAFVETLARFRPDPAVLAALDNIDNIDAGAAESTPRHGEVPNSWLATRSIGTATLGGEFVDLGAADTLAELRTALAARLVHYGFDDFDAATIRLSAPRRFTQEVARHVYELTDSTGRRTWDGIGYLSRLGDDLRNWAIFEPADLTVLATDPIARDDPDLIAALTLLGLELEAP